MIERATPELHRRFVEHIEKLREHGICQKDICRLIGVSPSMVTYWKKGDVPLTQWRAGQVLLVDVDGTAQRIVRVKHRPQGLGWIAVHQITGETRIFDNFQDAVWLAHEKPRTAAQIVDEEYGHFKAFGFSDDSIAEKLAAASRFSEIDFKVLIHRRVGADDAA